MTVEYGGDGSVHGTSSWSWNRLGTFSIHESMTKKSEGIEEWKDLVHAPWIETLGFKAKPRTFAIYRFLVAKVQTLRYDRRKFRSQTSDNMVR